MRARVRLLVGVSIAAALGVSLLVPQAGALGGALGHTPLSDRQLAGQRVIFSYAGLTPPAALLDHIRAGEAAGVIFFRENIGTPEQLAAAVGMLRQAQEQSPVRRPLLLMTDQEGGPVRRLPGAPELSAKQVGQAADPVTAARDAGTGAGANLAAAGMNLNLAPVLDVFTEPGNFIDQFQRSFSDQPETVAMLGTAFLRAQQRTGVAATAKHFPGLGAAPRGQNTDLTPVTLSQSLTELRQRDERPYASAIRAGVQLIMASWAVYPALDATRPAGLSPTVIQGELRGRLHFRGVTITDAIEAGSLQAFGTTAQRATLAAAAGMDLILCAVRDPAQGADAVDGLATALTAGNLNRRAFQSAVTRIQTLRATLP
jgi:beta-N-acetylhexosaminidase